MSVFVWQGEPVEVFCDGGQRRRVYALEAPAYYAATKAGCSNPSERVALAAGQYVEIVDPTWFVAQGAAQVRLEATDIDEQRVDNALNARTEFKALGNGVRDDTEALQRAIRASIRQGRPLYLPAGTYRCTDTLIEAAPGETLHIYGDGASTVLLHDAPGKALIKCTGTAGSNLTLTSTAPAGTSVVPVATASLVAGDVIALRDLSRDGPRSVWDNAMVFRYGQMARVKSIDTSGQLTIRGRLIDDLVGTGVAATSSRVTKITPVVRPKVRSLVIRNNAAEGAAVQGTTGIEFMRTRGALVENVDFYDMDDDCISFDRGCMDWIVRNCFFQDCRNDTSNFSPYCIRVGPGCSNWLIESCFSRHGRHLVTLISDSDQPAPMWGRVLGCHGIEHENAPFDTHWGSRFITFDSCGAWSQFYDPTFVGVPDAGFKIRGFDIEVVNPYVQGFTAGIYFAGSTGARVTGARIDDCDIGVRYRMSDDCSVIDAKIKNPKTNGILVEAGVDDFGFGIQRLELDDIRIDGDPSGAAVDFVDWDDSFRVGRIDARDATVKVQGMLARTVASAATITVPKHYGELVTVTGTTGISSITAGQDRMGDTLRLRFEGSLTVTDGSNLKLNGNFSATADDTLTVACFDGVNWTETGRSAN